MIDKCKNFGRYKGIKKPRCCNGEGCRACWNIYYTKRNNVTQPIKQRTNVIFVLDNSGSMSSFTNAALKTFNQWINDVKENAKRFNQETNISIITFGSRFKTLMFDVPSDEVSPISCYNPNEGSTCLVEGVANAIATISKTEKYSNYDDSYLVQVLTDGYENSSPSHIKNMIQGKIAELLATDRWTFTFMVPPGHTIQVKQWFGTDMNVKEWEQTSKGISDVSQCNTLGLNNYYQARSIGKMSVQNFYSNLDNVSQKTIMTQCVDLSAKVIELVVDKICQIRPFVFQQTGDFVKGKVYYELLKPEIVQPAKDLLIKHKKTGSVYGGVEARKLAGLPLAERIKVIPGRHGDYDIFVQSTSINRKLSAGSRVLVLT